MRLPLFVIASLALGWASGLNAQTCLPNPAYFAELRQRVLHPPAGHVVAVAHRACFAAAPENSPEAIDACWRMGVEVVENDVRMLKDGTLVVMHDPTINRTTDGWGYLNDLTLADLEDIHLRDGEGGPGAAVTPYPVTTLRDYFRAAKNKVMINLELKPSALANLQTLIDQSLSMAREEGVLDHIVLKVPDLSSHGKVSASLPIERLTLPEDVLLWPIIWQSEGADPTSRLDQLEPYHPDGYEIPFLKSGFFQTIARDPRIDGRPVMAVAVQPYWSGGLSDDASLPEPEAGWGQLVNLGANVVMTDHPEYLLRFLEGEGMRLAHEKDRCAR